MHDDTNTPYRGEEHRRDRRFEVAQSAIITQPGHTEIACEIRDFCFGGMFLRFTNPEAAIAALAQRADAEVEIYFTPAATETSQAFRIPAQLKRLSPLGVGIAFVRQPVDALRALQKLRMARHRQKLAALPDTIRDTQLRDASTVLLTEALQQCHDLMTRQLANRIGDAAKLVSGISEHSAMLSAVHELARESASIQTRLVDNVINALQQTASIPLQADGSELALVDELDFEDWLATSSEVNKLEEYFREQLAELEPRVGQLFGISCDHNNNPFGPAVICHGYRTAIENLPIPARARQVAYSTLRDTLNEQLAPLYAELLALLPVAKVVPVARSTSPRRHESASPGSTAQDSPESTAALAQAQTSLGRMASSLMDFFRGRPNPAIQSPDTSGYATQGGVPSDNGAPVSTAGMMASPVLRRLAAAGALPPAVTVEMQRSADMFGALFDTMHTEKSVSESMKPFFHQLETSLIKLAMTDPGFLASPVHPAHKVLNTLDRISMVAGENGTITDQRLVRLMARWTDRINAEAEKNPGVFEEARTQLERVVKPLLSERAARVFRLQEMCEGRQGAEVTKQTILRQLLGRLDDRSVPNVVIELLNGGWRNVLLIAQMRHGADSDEVREAWATLDRLTSWLDPATEQTPDVAEAQALLQHIDHSLTQVCADKFAQDRLIDQIATALFDQDRVRLEQTEVRARLNDATAEPLTDAQDTLVERLRVGDWLRFKSVDAPLNLIWIGDQPHVYVFANYRGIKKLDLKRADLLAMLESGEAEWTEDLELPLMDRSYSAMIQKMQRDLVWQAAHDPGTGLANRRHFFRSIRRAWLRGTTGEGVTLCVIQLDISLPSGEAAGADIRTRFLRDLAHTLPTQLPADALLARAGESGLAYWCGAGNADDAEAQARNIVDVITAHAITVDGIAPGVSAMAGLIWTEDGLHPEACYDNANAACATARENGMSVVQYHDETGQASIRALAQWAHDLSDILAHNRLTLNVQPVVAANDTARTVRYYEVLLHPEVLASQQPVETRDLIDVAERLQRITEIDRWVVRRVMQWMRDHIERLPMIGGFSIKLSGQSLINPLFLKFVLAELARGDLPGSMLIFEISEASAAEGHAQAQLFMRQLQRYGCRFTLDDFGAGASSYTRLKSMKLDHIKLDRALVREVNTSMIDEALVRSILETGQFLEVKTIAGFIENEATLAKLAELGVDYVQGYLIGTPQPLETLA